MAVEGLVSEERSVLADQVAMELGAEGVGVPPSLLDAEG